MQKAIHRNRKSYKHVDQLIRLKFTSADELNEHIIQSEKVDEKDAHTQIIRYIFLFGIDISDFVI